jgi:hypothetical protein
MTGGTATHDAIVWGAGEDAQSKNKVRPEMDVGGSCCGMVLPMYLVSWSVPHVIATRCVLLLVCIIFDNLRNPS